MPAANFGRSDYITLGYLISSSDLEQDEGYLADVRAQIEDAYADELEEIRETGDESDLTDFIDNKIDEYIHNDIEFEYEDAYYSAEDAIETRDFHGIELEIKSGYYEGYWIDISIDFSNDLESESDREYLYEEIGKLGELLEELVGMGWRTVSSSCYFTHRAEKEETYAAVARAMQTLIQEAESAEIYDYDEPSEPDDYEE